MRYTRGSLGATSLALVVLLGFGNSQAMAQAKGRAAKQPAATAQNRSGSMMHAGGYGRNYYNNNNAAANQNTMAVVQNLHTTLRTLAQADHDYNGHRVKAMHEIGTAIRHLEPQAAKMNQANPATSYLSSTGRTGNGSTTKNAMPQTASDQHLRTALQSLNQIGTYVSNNGTNQNHARALNSIQQAMRELNTALSVR